MEKVRVCHVVSGLKSGGVESMILNYCSLLEQNKYDFHILYQHEPSKKNVDEFEKINFKLCRIPSKIKHPIKNFTATYKYLKNNNIDVVHCHMTLMNFIPLVAARLLKIKVRICHSHNSDVRKKNIIVKFVEKILKKLCINNSTNLVSCGEDAGKYMYGNRKFEILYNALDLDKFKYNEDVRNSIRKKYNIDDNCILIGHIGRFTEQKNHKFIVDIISSMNNKKMNIKFMLLGDGELREEIEQLVFDKNIQENVIFTGIVPNSNEYYSAFDLFILPSLWEGLPVVGVEAQAAGLLCIFSNNIDKNVEVVQENVLLIENQLDLWCDKICQLIDRQSQSRNIRNDAFDKRNLNIKIEFKKLDDMYNVQ